MEDIDSTVQYTISSYNNSTVQFRVLWTIPNYLALRTSCDQPKCIKLKPQLTIIPEKCVFGIKVYPNGVTTARPNYTSIHVVSNTAQNASVCLKVSILDSNSRKHFTTGTYDADEPIDQVFGAVEFFQNDHLESNPKIMLPNGCLQILFEGKAWAEKQVHYTKPMNELLMDSNIRSTYTDPKFSDATLSVGDEVFQVNKQILISRSSFLEEFFKKHVDNVTVLPNVDPVAFKEVLHFLYTDTVSANIENMIPDVMKIAHDFELESLKEICEIKLIRKMNVDSVFEYLKIAKSLKAWELKEKCLDYIVGHRRRVSRHESWRKFKSLPSDLYVDVMEKLIAED